MLKREDLQPVRSYKIRGAFHAIASLSEGAQAQGVVCASAGNHAQGVAYACQQLGIEGHIFMPVTTPHQKIDQVRHFGKGQVTLWLRGDTFDDCFVEAQAYAQTHGAQFIHPFDDPKIIEGQATVALEILEDAQTPIDYLFVPIGGGGLAAGAIRVFSALSPQTRIIGVEPEGAASMQAALAAGEVVTLPEIDKFVDGAAVKRVGVHTLAACQEGLHALTTVPEGQICCTILALYNRDALVVEPAGALSIAALEQWREALVGKNVVCVVSGSNNDILRTEEIRERAMRYQGLKHYFLVRFPQRSGALKEFVNDILEEGDDITFFQYIKKNNREYGPVVVGLEVPSPEALPRLNARMQVRNFQYEYINNHEALLQLLV
jgi:threonine dehydratase